MRARHQRGAQQCRARLQYYVCVCVNMCNDRRISAVMLNKYLPCARAFITLDKHGAQSISARITCPLRLYMRNADTRRRGRWQNAQCRARRYAQIVYCLPSAAMAVAIVPGFNIGGWAGKYCCAACQVADYRARCGAKQIRILRKCLMCDNTYYEGQRGRARLVCGNKCRVALCRARQKQSTHNITLPTGAAAG